MSTSNHSQRQVHLVGSVPLQNAEEVFRTASSVLGNRLPRIPDGETGNRLQWIMYQYILMSKIQGFEVVGGTVSRQQLTDEIETFIATPEVGFDMHQRQLQVKEGVDAGEITFPALGYSKVAIESYKLFSDLKQNGDIERSCRFQVSLPTPLACIQTFISPKGFATSRELYEQYKKAMLNELQRIADAIPANELAIQWDVCIEIVMLQVQKDKAPLAGAFLFVSLKCSNLCDAKHRVRSEERSDDLPLGLNRDPAIVLTIRRYARPSDK